LPLYEYQCKKCHSLMERIQKFSDSPLTVCPHCGGELEQVLSAPAIQFKGSGWYVNDYAKKGSVAAKGNGSTSSSSSESKADGSPSETTSDKDSSSSGKGKSGTGKDKTPAKN
jgi:putative FmdB family regulatory protein